ncbi:MAG TPA: acyl-CoA dehydratase activase-related protein [Nitrospirota bacterium]
MLRIGIPRMFAYHIYPRLWETFFRELGLEPVVSGPTTIRTVETASQISESEHCLPNKLFDAHLAELLPGTDAVFVPRVLSTIKGHISCPRFGPLPDAARADICRERMVLTIDLDESRLPLSKSLALLGKQLNGQKSRIQAAADTALRAMETAKKQRRKLRGKKAGLRFLLVGHPYVIHEDFFAGPILRKLETMDVEVDVLSFSGNAPASSFILWSTANQIYHEMTALSPAVYDGVIQLTVFNCGCDSMMIDTYRNVMKEKRVPFMYLMLDEHPAQSGMDTRVEAFVDSLRWRA